MKCSYRGCGKSRNTSPGLRLYGFPVKDGERCKRWIINSGNSLDMPLKKYEVKGLCEEHFIKEDFVNETKHRLIQMAVPKHYTDPLGHARRRERGLDVEENKTSVNSNTEVLSLSQKLQRDLQKMHMDQSNDRPIISSSHDIGEKEQVKSNTIFLRQDLLQRKDYKLQLFTKWNRKIKFFVRKSFKKDDPGGSTNKLQWLEEILKQRALDKKKTTSCYVIPINDLLASFEILEPSESFDFTDLEFGWHKSRDKVKCYSRKNNGISLHHFSSQSNCSKDTETCLGVKEEDRDIGFELKLEEEENFKDMPDMSSEYDFTNQDVKDEGISECQLHWSEDDKGSINIVNISKLQTEGFKKESANVSQPSRMIKKVRCKQRRNVIWTTESEKFNYIINRNRLQIRNLKSKLRKCHKELKRLRKSKPELGK